MQDRNKTNQFNPKLYRNETKRTGLVQNLTGTKQSEQIRPKPGKIKEETKWFSLNTIGPGAGQAPAEQTRPGEAQDSVV